MNLLLFYAIVFFLGITTTTSVAQEGKVDNVSRMNVKQAEWESKEVQKKVKRAEKESRKIEKAEKAEKKLEKAARKREDIIDDIGDKKKSIAKDERKILKLTEDMELDKIKGKPSPNDITKIYKKLDKLKLGVVTGQEKLRKLERKLQKN